MDVRPAGRCPKALSCCWWRSEGTGVALRSSSVWRATCFPLPFPSPARLQVSPGCWCKRKPKFTCCSFPNQLHQRRARCKGWSWPKGCCRCGSHYPFSLQLSSPVGGEHIRSPAVLGRGETNSQAVAPATAAGPQLAGWRQQTSVEDCGLVSQANGCVGRKSPCP